MGDFNSVRREGEMIGVRIGSQGGERLKNLISS